MTHANDAYYARHRLDETVIVLRKDEDAYRWYEEEGGADCEVSGATVDAALDAALDAWGVAEVDEWWPDGAMHCQCGDVTGVRCAEFSSRDAVVVEYMPAHLRASHEAAGNRGSYPRNGAVRLTVSPDCAGMLIEGEGGWCHIVD